MNDPLFDGPSANIFNELAAQSFKKNISDEISENIAAIEKQDVEAKKIRP